MKTKQTLCKQILCFLLLLTLFMSLFCLSSMAGDEISVIIDGTKVEFDVPPMMQNDRVFVPLRKIGEALGAVVGWEEETQTVTFSKGDITNVLVVGERTAVKNSAEGTETLQMDVAPFIINDRTLVPIRIITEALGGKVDWNGATKEVTLSINDKEIKMTIGKTLEKYGVAPVIIDGRTFVPVRFVADELGANVAWDDATKTVTIKTAR